MIIRPRLVVSAFLACFFVLSGIGRGTEPKAENVPSKKIVTAPGVVATLIIRACAKIDVQQGVPCTDERVRNGKITVTEFKNLFAVFIQYDNPTHQMDAFETVLIHKSDLNLPNEFSSPPPNR